MASTVVNVQDFVDARKFSPYQWVILGLSFLIIAFDGFDTAVMGFAVAPLARDWGIPPATLRGPLVIGLFGQAVGALSAGPIADRVGRRWVTIGAMAIFGSFSLATVWANDLQTLNILRFVTGLGLGAAQPIATALTAEYCPIKRRAFLISLMISGFTLGSAGGGFLAAYLIPNFGWQSVFWVGGLGPLVMIPILMVAFPESLQFLVVRGSHTRDAVARVLRKIDPTADIPADATFVSRDLGSAKQAALRGLFADRFTFGTIALWTAFFMGLFAVYLVMSWLPTLLANSGVDISRASALGAIFLLGGGVGALVVSWVMDHYKAHISVGGAYLIGAGVLLALAAGLNTGGLWFVGIALFLAGFFVAGAQSAMSPLSAAFYPTRCRGSGVSWTLGIGRFGAILGAYAGGTLLGIWEFQTIIAMLAIPSAIAGVAILAKGVYYGRHTADTPALAE